MLLRIPPIGPSPEHSCCFFKSVQLRANGRVLWLLRLHGAESLFIFLVRSVLAVNVIPYLIKRAENQEVLMKSSTSRKTRRIGGQSENLCLSGMGKLGHPALAKLLCCWRALNSGLIVELGSADIVRA